MKPSLFTPKERIAHFGNGFIMKDQYGVQLMCLGERERLQALVPPVFTVPVVKAEAGREFGAVYIYVVNIRQPTFSPWYMEGGVGVMVDYEGFSGIHFIGLQLSGPGALMGLCTGRDGSGLPKKLADRIRVERLGDRAHCFIERGGVRLLDVACDIGDYNQPLAKALLGGPEGCSPEHPIETETGCLLFRGSGGILRTLELIKYESPTVYRQWEPFSARVTLSSTVDDPWGEIPIDEVLGGGFMVSDNRVRSTSLLKSFSSAECMDLMQYLYTGKYDQCILEKEHQLYE